MAQERNTNGQFMKVYRYKTKAEYESKIQELLAENQELTEHVSSLEYQCAWLYKRACWLVRRRFNKLF